MMTCSPFFFFNDTATTEIYTLSLHDALPISPDVEPRREAGGLLRPRRRGDAGDPAGDRLRHEPARGAEAQGPVLPRRAGAGDPRRARGVQAQLGPAARGGGRAGRAARALTAMPRPDGRAPDQLRPVTLTRDFLLHPEGSVLVEFGATRVICTASVEDRVPPFLKGQGQGWVTAEDAMLPRSTNTRTPRDARMPSGRQHEIPRLVGRALPPGIDPGNPRPPPTPGASPALPPAPAPPPPPVPPP